MAGGQLPSGSKCACSHPAISCAASSEGGFTSRRKATMSSSAAVFAVSALTPVPAVDSSGLAPSAASP